MEYITDERRDCLCTDGCPKTKTIEWYSWKGKELQQRVVQMSVINIPIMVEYKLHRFNFCECVERFYAHKEGGVVHAVLRGIFKKDIVKYFKHVPKFEDGDKFIREINYMTDNGWYYTSELPLESIPKLWDVYNDEWQREVLNTGLLDHYLINLNLEYLKGCEFVSKRSNPYFIGAADINYLLNKYRKQYEPKNKQEGEHKDNLCSPI